MCCYWSNINKKGFLLKNTMVWVFYEDYTRSKADMNKEGGGREDTTHCHCENLGHITKKLDVMIIYNTEQELKK